MNIILLVLLTSTINISTITHIPPIDEHIMKKSVTQRAWGLASSGLASRQTAAPDFTAATIPSTAACEESGSMYLWAVGLNGQQSCRPARCLAIANWPQLQHGAGAWSKLRWCTLSDGATSRRSRSRRSTLSAVTTSAVCCIARLTASKGDAIAE